MISRKLIAIFLLILAILLIASIPVILFTPLLKTINGNTKTLAPLIALTYTPVAKAQAQAVLTPTGSPGTLTATEAYLLDADTGNQLYDESAEAAVPMASTTKIMTALIAIETGKLDQEVTIGKDAYNEWYLNNGSNAQLVVGDQITLNDLLYALMLPSGDDAAIAIADAVAGSESNFVTIMNVEAQKLHLYGTHFANPDGLPPTDSNGNAISGTHYSTGYDLAHLAAYAMRLPLFVQIVQTKEYDLPASGVHHSYQWKTTNTLLNTYTGLLGVKTGTTDQAGACLVFAAKRNGHTLVGVVLHSSEADRFTDAQKLLDWGFALPLKIPQVE